MTTVQHQYDLINAYVAGRKVHASRRTIAHLRWTIRRLKRRWPHARLVILQSCYHTGVAASAGTHDKDCALDIQIIGLPWWLAQRFLRNAGWAAWFRHTGEWADKDAWHLHAVSIPPGLSGHDVSATEVGHAYSKIGLVVGLYIDGGYTTEGHTVASSQIRDYFHRTFGLAGQHGNDADKSWFPKRIDRTIYRYNPTDVAA